MTNGSDTNYSELPIALSPTMITLAEAARIAARDQYEYENNDIPNEGFTSGWNAAMGWVAGK